MKGKLLVSRATRFVAILHFHWGIPLDNVRIWPLYPGLNLVNELLLLAYKISPVVNEPIPVPPFVAAIGVPEYIEPNEPIPVVVIEPESILLNVPIPLIFKSGAVIFSLELQPSVDFHNIDFGVVPCNIKPPSSIWLLALLLLF